MGIYPYILSIEIYQIYLWFCFGQVYQGYPYRLIVAGTLSYHPGTQPLERCRPSMLPFNTYLEWSPMVMFSWKVAVVFLSTMAYQLLVLSPSFTHFTQNITNFCWFFSSLKRFYLHGFVLVAASWWKYVSIIFSTWVWVKNQGQDSI